jgi:hypothetical protein
MLAKDGLMLPGLFKDEFEVLSQELQFPEDAGGDLEGGSAGGGVLKLALEVDVALHHDLEEVAVQQELVGIVELVVYPEEIYDSAHLLIVHSGLYYIGRCRLRVG